MGSIGVLISFLALVCFTQGLNNAQTSEFSAFPYVVSLQRISQIAQVTRGHHCGGALITLTHVLTSATCCNEFVNGVPTPKVPANYRVFTGASLLSADSTDRWRNINAFTPNPNYLPPPSHVNDIGIITLASAFPNNIGIIPRAISSSAPSESVVCTVAGWGAFEYNQQPSTQLRSAQKYIYEQELCKTLYALSPNTLNILNTMVCVAPFNIITTSNLYDEGNVVVCNNVASGVLTYYPGETTQSWPEVYSRTSNHTTWIRSITGSASVSSPAFIILALAALIQFFNV